MDRRLRVSKGVVLCTNICIISNHYYILYDAYVMLHRVDYTYYINILDSTKDVTYVLIDS